VLVILPEYVPKYVFVLALDVYIAYEPVGKLLNILPGNPPSFVTAPVEGLVNPWFLWNPPRPPLAANLSTPLNKMRASPPAEPLPPRLVDEL
jgi:hypothetical protein